MEYYSHRQHKDHGSACAANPGKSVASGHAFTVASHVESLLAGCIATDADVDLILICSRFVLRVVCWLGVGIFFGFVCLVLFFYGGREVAGDDAAGRGVRLRVGEGLEGRAQAGDAQTAEYIA